MKPLHCAAVFALLLSGNFSLPAQTARTGAEPAVPAAPKALHSFDTSFIDRTVDPCTDFYHYACGNWVKANPVPADQERIWIVGQLGDRNEYLLYKELAQAAAAPKTAIEKQYGTFFGACMDAGQADALGTKPIAPTLAAIAAIREKAQIAEFLGDKRYLSEGFFSFTAEQDERDATREIAAVHQGGLTLPDAAYYLNSGEGQSSILAQYRRYLVTIFSLLGDKPGEAAAEAEGVLAVETALARGSMSRVDMRDPNKTYHPMTPAQLERLAPNFAWTTYFSEVRPPAFQTINVAQPEYLRTMANVIAGQPLAALRSYLRIHAIDHAAPYLSSPFQTASFDFFLKTVRGQAAQQARWKRCTALTDKVLSDAVGQQWVRENFSPEMKAAVEPLIANVRDALAAEMRQLPWLSPAAREEAERKISAMRRKIGYPAHWRDYSHLQVTRGDFVADLHNAEILNREDRLAQIGKPVDEGRFFWTAPTVDADYDEHLNDIEFPAGILQPPWYSPSMDPAVNYGALGTLAGHEMTHGFDDDGSRYDEAGDLRNWFTADDRAAFSRMTACEVNEYNGFEPVPGLRLNGELSLGENTADNGGIRMAYSALQKVVAAEPAAERDRKIDGYTEDQRFFISFAQVWCETRTDAYQRMRGQTDPHPPGEFRVKGTVENFEPFGKAFGCHVGQPMMPASACHIW